MKLLLLTLLFFSEVNAGSMESIKLKTPRGVEIEAVLHRPDSQAKVPAIVIGPGQGYHMDLPLVKKLAEKAVEKGYAALRFNWNYQTEKKSPSEGLVNELEDYTTAVEFLKNNSSVDSTKITVVGKSLGTIVSYRYFKKDPQMKALVLMTPLCTRKWGQDGSKLPEPIATADQYYPELLADERPVVMALGNRDDLCSTPMLYDFLKGSKGNIATVVVEGDHSMNIGEWNDSKYKERNADNINAALNMVSHWIDLVFKR